MNKTRATKHSKLNKESQEFRHQHRLKKRYLALILIGVLGLGGYANRSNIQKLMTATPIPFNWLVNPNEVAQSKHFAKLSNTETENAKLSTLKANGMQITKQLNLAIKQNPRVAPKLLTKSNTEKMDPLLNKYRYLHNAELIGVGHNVKGSYADVYLSRYTDQPNIDSYTYRFYYAENKRSTLKVKSVTHTANSHRKTTPTPMFTKAPTSHDGLQNLTGQLNKLVNVLSASDLYSKASEASGQKEVLANVNGLRTTKTQLDRDSTNALYSLLAHSNGNFKSLAVTGISYTDIPNTSVFTLKEATNKKIYTFDLTFNRNQQKFTQLREVNK